MSGKRRWYASVGILLAMALSSPTSTALAREDGSKPERTGSTNPVTADLPVGDEAGIRWGECPAFDENIEQLPTRPRLECGVLDVPLDYADPDGETIEVAVSRLASPTPSERRGVLLLNPGGPGAPGLDLPIVIGLLAPPDVTERFDVIGFDPRGIRYSTPVSCGLSEAEGLGMIPSHPADRRDVAQRFDLIESVAAACVDADTAGHLPHITTRNTARDMDLIRRALGERKISYLGYSYGTYLGAVYAEMFTDHTDRFILDSAVGPHLVWREVFRLFGLGGEIAFGDFARWAAEHHDTYQLGTTPRQVRRTYLRLAEEFDEEVLGLDGRTFLQWTVFSALYSPATFPVAAEFLRSVDDDVDGGTGPASFMPLLGDPHAPDQLRAAQAAVLCGDTDWPSSVRRYQRDVAIDGRLFPLFGAMMANTWICAAWPNEPLESPTRITSDGPSNILILQNTRDPATVYGGGLDMRHTLGERAAMVTVDEVGHGVYLFHENTCAAGVATDFLTTGRLPHRDRYCAGETEPPTPQATFAPDTAREMAVRELLRRTTITGI